MKIYCSVIFLIFSSFCFSQNEIQDREILTSKLKSKDVNISSLGGELFVSGEINNYKSILLVQTKGQRKNNEMMLSIFRYFNGLDNNNSLVLEVPYSVKFMFDYWLKNKRELHFYGKKNGLKYYDRNKYKTIFKKLAHDYLKGDKKFNLYTIDLETDLYMSSTCLGIILNNHHERFPIELKDINRKLDSVQQVKYDEGYQKAILRHTNKYFMSHKDEIKNYLNQDYIAFESILRGAIDKIHYDSLLEHEGQVSAGNYREKILYNNYTELLQTFPNKRFCVQLGVYHLLDAVILDKIVYNDIYLGETITFSRLLRENNYNQYKVWFWYKDAKVTFYYPEEAKKLAVLSDDIDRKIGILDLLECEEVFPVLSRVFNKVVLSTW